MFLIFSFKKSVVFNLFFLLQKILGEFDRNEETVVYTTQCVSNIERCVSDKSVQQLKRTCKNNTDKFIEIRRKLKDKEILVEGDLKDAEELSSLYITVEERQKIVEDKMAEIKEDSKEPDDIRRNLEIAKEIQIIIIEIITIIEIIEKVIIVIKKKHKDSSSVLKSLASKDNSVKSFKKKANQSSEKIKEKQIHLETELASSEDIKDRLSRVVDWLPKLEANLLIQAPISADFHILHRQQIEQTVRNICLLFSKSIFQCVFSDRYVIFTQS